MQQHTGLSFADLFFPRFAMAKRRRDDDDDGFEVVDEEPPPRKKKPSRRPESENDTRPVRSAAAETKVDNDFEVVDDDEDDRPRKKKASKYRDDDADDDRPRAKKSSKYRDDDADDRPRSKRRRDDDEDEDRSRKKKSTSRLTKKDRARMRREDEEAKDAARDNAVMEWGVPIFLMFLGTIMMVVAGTIFANRSEGLINPPLLLGIAFVFTLVMIPLIIIALMVIGAVMGIEYGTLKNAVRSLAAISLMSWGIFFVSHLYFIGWAIGPVVSFMVTLGLFMTFFSLDINEAMSTLGALNLIMWLMDKLFWLVVIVAISRGANRDRDFDPDDGPQIQQNQGNFDDGDGGGNNFRGRRNRNNIDPDDDDGF
jgi:hypothetical protein